MKPIPSYTRWWRYKSYLPDASLPAHTVDCPDCGNRMDIPRLRQGQEAHCPVCNHEVVEVENNPYVAPLAYATTSLILMAFAYSMVYIRVELFGVTSVLSLPEMMRLLIYQDYGFLAEVMFVLTFGAPVLFLLLCLYVYTALVRERAYPALRFATRVLVRLRHAIMVDVFFISTLVAYIKLSSVAAVEFGSAFYLMFALSVMLIRTSVSIPQHWVYYKIHRLTGGDAVQTASDDKTCCSRCLYFRDKDEQPCEVCGADLYRRRPKSLSISLAFFDCGVYPVFPREYSADYDFVEPYRTGSQYDFQWHCVYVERRRQADCGDYFQREYFGAGIEDYRDGGFDCVRLFQTADECAENVGALPDYRIHRPLVDD